MGTAVCPLEPPEVTVELLGGLPCGQSPGTGVGAPSDPGIFDYPEKTAVFLPSRMLGIPLFNMALVWAIQAWVSMGLTGSSLWLRGIVKQLLGPWLKDFATVSLIGPFRATASL